MKPIIETIRTAKDSAVFEAALCRMVASDDGQLVLAVLSAVQGPDSPVFNSSDAVEAARREGRRDVIALLWRAHLRNLKAVQTI